MPRTSYTPTEADALTGRQIRALRQRAGETLRETVEQSGFGKDASTLAATERGQRLLTDVEAAKLAAHFGTSVEKIRRPKFLFEYGDLTVATEQQWLGNDRDPKPTLFAVPDPHQDMVETADRLFADVKLGPGNVIVIDRDAPLTPEQYREQVWIPYLEARYSTEQKAG